VVLSTTGALAPPILVKPSVANQSKGLPCRAAPTPFFARVNIKTGHRLGRCRQWRSCHSISRSLLCNRSLHDIFSHSCHTMPMASGKKGTVVRSLYSSHTPTINNNRIREFARGCVFLGFVELSLCRSDQGHWSDAPLFDTYATSTSQINQPTVMSTGRNAFLQYCIASR
jgi:hypothetical protein